MIPRESLCLAVCSILVFAPPTPGGKLASNLQESLKTLSSRDEVPVIITFSDRTNVRYEKGKDRALRRSKMIRGLRTQAQVSGESLRDFLRREGVRTTKPLWIIDAISVRLRPDAIRRLEKLPGLDSVRVDHALRVAGPAYSGGGQARWNLDAIQAPGLWNLGYTGKRMVVAALDSGVDYRHPDLAAKWRGGTNSWYDPHGRHSTPFDPTGHGTQVMGLIVGGDTSGNFIGVAPDAQWIAATILDDNGAAQLSDIHQGFQWLLDPDGNPDTDDAPDVVNYSFGFSDQINECILEFQPDIQALKAAGILIAFAGGNQGPTPATSVSPANNPETLAVGAVDASQLLASFSSRGPRPLGTTVFPDLVAPGVNVKTLDLSFEGLIASQTFVSGTSFSAAHVTGVMVLLRQAFPHLTVADIERVLRQTAGDLGPAGPDNDYGYGLVKGWAAYQSLRTTDPESHPYALGDLNRDHRVDWDDFALFSRQWTQINGADSDGCTGADLDQNGRVDWNDCLLLQSNLYSDITGE